MNAAVTVQVTIDPMPVSTLILVANRSVHSILTGMTAQGLQVHLKNPAIDETLAAATVPQTDIRSQRNAASGPLTIPEGNESRLLISLIIDFIFAFLLY